MAECGYVVAGCGWTTSLWFGSRDLVERSSLDVLKGAVPLVSNMFVFKKCASTFNDIQCNMYIYCL